MTPKKQSFNMKTFLENVLKVSMNVDEAKKYVNDKVCELREAMAAHSGIDIGFFQGRPKDWQYSETFEENGQCHKLLKTGNRSLSNPSTNILEDWRAIARMECIVDRADAMRS